ncbi:hypothetical protein Scep_011606 [Stephania cephalantha]|uniref:Protein FAR1-RELATED SEQUENCE n=1 Tax=Stephania cephalantha TaxID=152367 RepID=A0AAP0JFG1_9MAGN
MWEVKVIKSPSGVDTSESRTYVVWYSPLYEAGSLQCVCRMLEFIGILCCYVLCVLDEVGVTVILPAYVVDRWRKDYKRLHVLEEGTLRGLSSTASTTEEKFDAIATKCTQLAELGYVSSKKFEKVIDGIQNMLADSVVFVDEYNVELAQTPAQTSAKKGQRWNLVGGIKLQYTSPLSDVRHNIIFGGSPFPDVVS